MKQFSQDAPPILNSWKEIAAYLGRGVRTVQRWEREQHLPIHRVGQGMRSPVFAFTRELNMWMRTADSGVLRFRPNGKPPESSLGALKLLPSTTSVGASLCATRDTGDTLEHKARIAQELSARSLERVRVTAELTAYQLSQTKQLLTQLRALRIKQVGKIVGISPGV